MPSLKTVSVKVGVTPQAVRKWLQKNNYLKLCYQPGSNRVFIPDEIEAEILTYYQVKDQKKPNSNHTEILIETLQEQVTYLKKQNDELLALLNLSMAQTDQAQKRLEASQALQAADKGLLPENRTETPIEPKQGFKTHLTGAKQGFKKWFKGV